MSHLKLWRLQFSVRTLAIFVTLVCAYFGAWEATKRYGTRLDKTTRFFNYKGGTYSYDEYVLDASSPCPFVVRRDVYEMPNPPLTVVVNPTRRYYLWLFGTVWKMPIDEEPLPHPKRWEPVD